MRPVSLEFGKGQITFHVPDDTDILAAGAVSPLSDPQEKIQHALAQPIATESLADLAVNRANAAIVVSDNTRPVPYTGESGILKPIINTLKQAGLNDILIIVATGTHRSMTEPQLREITNAAVQISISASSS